MLRAAGLAGAPGRPLALASGGGAGPESGRRGRVWPGEALGSGGAGAGDSAGEASDRKWKFPRGRPRCLPRKPDRGPHGPGSLDLRSWGFLTRLGDRARGALFGSREERARTSAGESGETSVQKRRRRRAPGPSARKSRVGGNAAWSPALWRVCTVRRHSDPGEASLSCEVVRRLEAGGARGGACRVGVGGSESWCASSRGPKPWFEEAAPCQPSCSPLGSSAAKYRSGREGGRQPSCELLPALPALFLGRR